jgi:hypothetical protein
MTAKELATLLDGREYRQEITAAEEAQAKESGLLVIFAYSDDLIQFRGLIDDEVDAYNDIELYVNPNGSILQVEDGFDDYSDYIRHLQENNDNRLITHVKIQFKKDLSGKDRIWQSITTDVPHETFKVTNEGELFVEGLVIDSLQMLWQIVKDAKVALDTEAQKWYKRKNVAIVGHGAVGSTAIGGVSKPAPVEGTVIIGGSDAIKGD